jgi:hypothetical protein
MLEVSRYPPESGHGRESEMGWEAENVFEGVGTDGGIEAMKNLEG